MSKVECVRLPDRETQAFLAAEFAAWIAREAVSQRGRCDLLLAGGATPRRTYEVLAGHRAMPWDRTHLFLGDERCTAEDDPRRNWSMVAETLLATGRVPQSNLHPMPLGADPAGVAEAYQETLRQFFALAPGQFPAFDLAFLGLGRDGHTASLFPGDPAVEEAGRLVVAVSGAAGDPPVPRASLTLPALSASRAALFLATGPAKAALAEAILSDPQGSAACYPAARVRAGRTIWYVCSA
jgi:6-phosphogluconolactonase